MNTTPETEFVAPALIKPRNPRITRQLAWTSVGMGHMYLGLLVRGLCFMTGTYLPVCLAVVALMMSSPNWIFIASCLCISFLVNLWAVWDAIQCGHQTRADYRLKDYNRPAAYLMFCLVTTACLGVGSAAVLSAIVGSPVSPAVDFLVPEFSKDDYLFCSKLAYRSHLPAKNDQVLFRDRVKGHPTIFPGLVLAVAGESVSMNSKTVVVPPDHVCMRIQSSRGVKQERFVSNYAIVGKTTFRFWPLSRIGKIPDGSTH